MSGVAPARLRRVLSLLAVVALTTTTAGPAQAATAELRVFHGRPAAGLLDLEVDGALRLRRVVEGTASEYLRLPPGRHTVLIRRSAGRRRALTRLRVVLRVGRAHTLAVTGPPLRPGLRLLVDDRRTLRRAARVRLVHLLPGRPPLRLVVRGGDTTAGGRLRFGAASPYRRLPAAAFPGGVLPIDLLDVGAGRVVARARLGVRTGRAYSVFVIPARPRGPLRLVLAQDS